MSLQSTLAFGERPLAALRPGQQPRLVSRCAVAQPRGLRRVRVNQLLRPGSYGENEPDGFYSVCKHKCKSNKPVTSYGEGRSPAPSSGSLIPI